MTRATWNEVIWLNLRFSVLSIYPRDPYDNSYWQKYATHLLNISCLIKFTFVKFSPEMWYHIYCRVIIISPNTFNISPELQKYVLNIDMNTTPVFDKNETIHTGYDRSVWKPLKQICRGVTFSYSDYKINCKNILSSYRMCWEGM